MINVLSCSAVRRGSGTFASYFSAFESAGQSRQPHMEMSVNVNQLSFYIKLA